jgi:two-component system competent response regulator ComA
VAASVISTATTGSVAPPSATPHPVALTDLDLVIVKHAARGLTNKQIAAAVHLSRHTIKDRLAKIYELFGVSSRTEIVAEALRRGLI